MNSKELRQLANGLDVLDNINSVDKLQRLKDNQPFSQQLNDWVTKWYEDHKDKFVFTETDDFDPNDIEGTLHKHIRRYYQETGKIHVWTGASDNTIFADPKVNHYFRAWHDYIHVTQNYGYDFIGESIVADIQRQQLPKEWIFERELVMCEVVGQAQYNMIQGDFVNNQRQFTMDYLRNCLVTLRKKY